MVESFSQGETKSISEVNGRRELVEEGLVWKITCRESRRERMENDSGGGGSL